LFPADESQNISTAESPAVACKLIMTPLLAQACRLAFVA